MNVYFYRLGFWNPDPQQNIIKFIKRPHVVKKLHYSIMEDKNDPKITDTTRFRADVRKYLRFIYAKILDNSRNDNRYKRKEICITKEVYLLII